MNCHYCNNQLPPGAATCPFCGARIKAQPSAVPLTPVPPQAQYPQAQYPQTTYPQTPGCTFMLMPGERLLLEGSMQRIIFPSGSTYMRLTDRRLVFCHISRWLTFVSWLFYLYNATKISQTFTREEIAMVEIKSFLLQKRLVITDFYGRQFTFCEQWLSGKMLQGILNWWQTGWIG